MLIDSHAHIDAESFDADRDGVLERAAEAGVEAIIVIGAAGTLETVRRAVELARSHPQLYATVGVHPHDASRPDESWWPELARLAADPVVCGIGETGLDSFYDHSPMADQEACMHAQLALATECHLPVVLHIRDCHKRALEILAEYPDSRGVVHCFTGDSDDALAYLDLGFYLSISGIVTFPKAQELRTAVERTPVSRLLVETDCPYLAPVPVRGKRNEPSFVVHTAQALAHIKGMDYEELAAATTANAREVFALT